MLALVIAIMIILKCFVDIEKNNFRAQILRNSKIKMYLNDLS